MLLSLDVKNEKILNKLLWLLKHFEKDGVKILKQTKNKSNIKKNDDKYIEENWKELVSEGLSNYDEDYYKSDKYKEDRGNALMEKYK